MDIAEQFHMTRQIGARGALAQLLLVPLVTGEHRPAQPQGGVQPVGAQMAQRLQGDVDALARGEPGHHGDAEGRLREALAQRGRRILRRGDAVVDDLGASFQGRLRAHEGVSRGLRVDHDAGSGQQRSVEPGAHQQVLGVLGLVDVREHRHPGGTPRGSPPRQGHGVDQDEVGVVRLDQAPQSGDLPAGARHQSGESAGAHQGFAQHGEGHDRHSRTEGLELGPQRPVVGQSGIDPVAGIDQGPDRLQ